MPDLPAARVADFPGELTAFLDELNREPAEGDGATALRRRLRALRQDASIQIAELREKLGTAERERDAALAELAAIRRSAAFTLAHKLSRFANRLRGRRAA